MPLRKCHGDPWKDVILFTKLLPYHQGFAGIWASVVPANTQGSLRPEPWRKQDLWFLGNSMGLTFGFVLNKTKLWNVVKHSEKPWLWKCTAKWKHFLVLPIETLCSAKKPNKTLQSVLQWKLGCFILGPAEMPLWGLAGSKLQTTTGLSLSMLTLPSRGARRTLSPSPLLPRPIPAAQTRTPRPSFLTSHHPPASPSISGVDVHLPASVTSSSEFRCQPSLQVWEPRCSVSITRPVPRRHCLLPRPFPSSQLGGSDTSLLRYRLLQAMGGGKSNGREGNPSQMLTRIISREGNAAKETA